MYKWKARLTIDGSKQKYGIHYWETYAPVVTWPAIRLFLVLSIVLKWHTRQLDFVLAYTQADVETDLYMEIPKGFQVEGDRKRHTLKLIKNLYGQKQAGRVWNQHLTKCLQNLGFKQSKVDECIFYYKRSIFIVFTDDTILLGPSASELDTIVSLLQWQFQISDEGDLCDYLGIQMKKRVDGSLELTQPHLIQSILCDLKLVRNHPKSTPIPSLTSRILTQDSEGADFDKHFDYRSVIGKLSYLEKSTRPEIAYAVHQCTRFCATPKKSHGEAVKRIGRYLLGTTDKGLILAPASASFECWADASHAGEWTKTNADM